MNELKYEGFSKFSINQEKKNSIKIDMLDSNRITLNWKDLNVLKPKKNRIFNKQAKDSYKISPKKIISNVDGYANSGEILAIMGASGAGKTTLLNVLNFRNRGKLKITGQIGLNGKSVKTIEEMREASSYVQQDDLFIGYLTVKEHLLFQVNI